MDELNNAINSLLYRKNFAVYSTKDKEYIEVLSTVKAIKGEEVLSIQVFNSQGELEDSFIDTEFTGKDCIIKYLEQLYNN